MTDTIKVLTYNVNYQSLEGKFIKPEHNNVNYNAKNIAKIITSIEKDIDIIALQEINYTNDNQWNNSLLKYIEFFDDNFLNKYKFHKKDINIITLVNNEKYDVILNISANISDLPDKRPALTTYIVDKKTKQDIIIFNLHTPHDSFKDKWKKIEKFIITSIKTILIEKKNDLLNDPLFIICGDMNNDKGITNKEILEKINNIFDKYNKYNQKNNINWKNIKLDTNLNPINTCCYSDNFNSTYDFIFSSNSIVNYNVLKQEDNEIINNKIDKGKLNDIDIEKNIFKNASDHLPVYATISLHKKNKLDEDDYKEKLIEEKKEELIEDDYKEDDNIYNYKFYNDDDKIYEILEDLHTNLLFNRYFSNKETIFDYMNENTNFDDKDYNTKFSYIVAGSYGINLIYNENKMNEINKIHKDLLNENVIMNSLFESETFNDIDINNYYKDIKKSFWVKMRNIDITKLFKSYDYNIHFKLENNNDTYENKENIKKLENNIKKYCIKLQNLLNDNINNILFENKKFQIGGTQSFLDKILLDYGYKIEKYNNQIVQMKTIISYKKDSRNNNPIIIRLYYNISNKYEDIKQIKLLDFTIERGDNVPTTENYQLDIPTDFSKTINFYNTQYNSILLLLKNYKYLIQLSDHCKRNKYIFRLLIILNLLKNPELLSLNTNNFISNNKPLIIDELNQINEIFDRLKYEHDIYEIIKKININIINENNRYIIRYGQLPLINISDINLSNINKKETNDKSILNTITKFFTSYNITPYHKLEENYNFCHDSNKYNTQKFIFNAKYINDPDLRNVLLDYTNTYHKVINNNLSININNDNNLIPIEKKVNNGEFTYSEYLIKIINEMDYKSLSAEYFFVLSDRPFYFYNKQKHYGFENLNKGDILLNPYIISTTYDIEKNYLNFQKDYGYKFLLFVNNRAKYINIADFSPFDYECEIILPPGKIIYLDKFVHEYIDDSNLYKKINVIIGIYQNLDDLPYKFDDLRNYFITYNKSLHNSEYDEYNFDDTKSANIYITSIAPFLTIYNYDDLPNYFLEKIYKNINPLENMFSVNTDVSYGEYNGLDDGIYFYNIDYTITLHSGRNINNKFNDTMYFSEYNTAWFYGYVRNNHTFTNDVFTYELKGTPENPIKLLDILNANNVKHIYNFYMSDFITSAEADCLNTYFNFDKHYDKYFIFNNKKISYFNYNGLRYGSKHILKYSASTQNDTLMYDILTKKIFKGFKFDGYICKASFSMEHKGNIFSDEICIKNCLALHNNNILSIKENSILNFYNIPTNPVNKQIFEAMYSLYYNMNKLKINPLYDHFQTDQVYNTVLTKHDYWVYNFFENIYKFYIKNI